MENLNAQDSLERVADELKQDLGSRAAIHFLAAIGSTNSWLKQQFELGSVVRPSLVLTDRQTAGRGTRGREWVQAGHDLALTAGVILPASVEIDQRYSLAVGAVCAVAIEEATGVSTKVKWPNDVLAGPPTQAGTKLKVCGILIETVVRQREKLLVAGVGVNVNSTAADYPAALSGRLTTLRDALGTRVERANLLRQLAPNLLNLLGGLHDAGAATQAVVSLLDEWFARDATAGSRYMFHRGEVARPVIAVRVDRPTCGLVVSDEQRREYLVTAYTELTAADESG